MLAELNFYFTFFQLSALVSDIGLNIREAHVFSTTDGYSLDAFVVDGWPVEVIPSLFHVPYFTSYND